MASCSTTAPAASCRSESATASCSPPGPAKPSRFLKTSCSSCAKKTSSPSSTTNLWGRRLACRTSTKTLLVVLKPSEPPNHKVGPDNHLHRNHSERHLQCPKSSLSI